MSDQQSWSQALKEKEITEAKADLEKHGLLVALKNKEKWKRRWQQWNSISYFKGIITCSKCELQK